MLSNKSESDLQESCCSPDLRNAFISWPCHIQELIFSCLFVWGFFVCLFAATICMNAIYVIRYNFTKCVIHRHIYQPHDSLLVLSFVQHHVTVSTSAGNRQPDCEIQVQRCCIHYSQFYLTHFYSYILYHQRSCFCLNFTHVDGF